jgi:LysR family glycine cleavage system transcriptional activator
LPAKIDLRKLPPLNALKGFEAATRRQSVREAADELFLTHPAVSYQIQVLEQDLGVELFSRAGRSLAPTAEGRLFYRYVRQALETLIEGVESVRRARADSPLRVQTYVTASIRWLARKLPDFVAAHPDVKILLTTYAYDWAFDDTIADVGLVYCEKTPGPALAQQLRSAPTPAAVLELPLVAIYSEAHHWDLWCESAQLVYSAKPAIVVDTLAVALEIALDGRGVALVNGPFDTDYLAEGKLVMPVSHEFVCPGSWGLICRRESQDNPRVKAFMDWLVRAAAIQ